MLARHSVDPFEGNLLPSAGLPCNTLLKMFEFAKGNEIL
jgi:hypothetical protein